VPDPFKVKSGRLVELDGPVIAAMAPPESETLATHEGVALNSPVVRVMVQFPALPEMEEIQDPL
jgi:hypothetical protein